MKYQCRILGISANSKDSTISTTYCTQASREMKQKFFKKNDFKYISPVQRTEPTHNQVGEKGAALQQLNPEMVVAKWAQSLTPRAGTIAYLPCKQPTQKRLCYTGPIAYPKSWYDRLLRPTCGAIYKNNSVTYPKSGTIDYFAPRAAQPRFQLGRLPQEWYDRLLRQRSGTSTPTTRSPTIRVVRSITSSK